MAALKLLETQDESFRDSESRRLLRFGEQLGWDVGSYLPNGFTHADSMTVWSKLVNGMVIVSHVNVCTWSPTPASLSTRGTVRNAAMALPIRWVKLPGPKPAELAAGLVATLSSFARASGALGNKATHFVVEARHGGS
jgi:hypothetical protein